MRQLQLRNRQRNRTLKLPVLRKISAALLDELLPFTAYELAIQFVSARTMAAMNAKFLGHTGPTDVITFDLREGYDSALQKLDLAGEIYICVSIAEKQATEFDTRWEEELVRYIVHGVLHLIGYDDLVPAKRRMMKREENRLLKSLGRQFKFAKIST